jgi:hypothetical protein
MVRLLDHSMAEDVRPSEHGHVVERVPGVDRRDWAERQLRSLRRQLDVLLATKPEQDVREADMRPWWFAQETPPVEVVQELRRWTAWELHKGRLASLLEDYEHAKTAKKV